MELRRRFGRLGAAAAVLCAAAALALLVEVRRGAFRDDFGMSGDEPAHFVSCLVVRDYLVHGLGQNPLAYAVESYRRRPKIAIGHWPPLYYAAAGVWMTAFGPGRASILFFQALLVGLGSMALWMACRLRVGRMPALAVALSFPLLPDAALVYAAVMLEAANSLLYFIALLALERLLSGGRRRDALWFGALAAAAAMTRIDSLALLPAAPLAVLAAGRLRRPLIWVSFAVVLIVAGPFYAVFHAAMRDGSVGAVFDVRRILAASRFYATLLPAWVSWPVAVLAVWGAIDRMRRPPGDPARLRAAVLACGILCGLLILVAAPGSVEGRRLFLIALPAIALAAEGLDAVGRVHGLRWAPAPLSVFVLLVASWSAYRLWPNNCYAFARLAFRLQQDPALRRVPLILAASDATGEGRLIASVAAMEDGPARWIARASKLFAESDWMGSNHRLRISGPGEVLQAAERMPAGIVVLHSATDGRLEFPEYRLVRDAMEGAPPGWRLAYEDRHTCNRHGPEILRVFINPSLAALPLREPPGGPDLRIH